MIGAEPRRFDTRPKLSRAILERIHGGREIPLGQVSRLEWTGRRVSWKIEVGVNSQAKHCQVSVAGAIFLEHVNVQCERA